MVEDDVFIGPGVTLTNDNTMGRHEPGAGRSGALLRRACRVGAGVVICPGVEIGEEAFVAAGAVVAGDVPPRTVVARRPRPHDPARSRSGPSRELAMRIGTVARPPRS